jgi:pimeloyl-ACP methyl ester carboxylesterase
VGLHYRETDLLANGVRLHVYRTGGPKPPIVLAHGITDNGLCWTPVAEVLAPHYDVILYDARGHGLSEAPRAAPTWQALADDLAALVRALGLSQPAALGHSMGAVTVATAAAQNPEMFERIILCDPPWGEWNRGSEAERRAMQEQWRAGIVARRAMDRAALIAQCRADSPSWSEAELGPWADSKLQVDPIVAALIGDEPGDWTATARAITCPTLLLHADVERGAIVTPEVASQAVKLLARGQSRHIAGAGHSIRREQFDAYMQAVLAFLKSWIAAKADLPYKETLHGMETDG